MSTTGDGKRRSGQERLNAAENKVVCIGLSHKTASVEVRERLAVQEQHWQEVQNKIAELPSVKEAAIISTCNRHEIYIVTSDTHKGIQEVTNFLSVAHGVAKRDLRASLFLLTEDDAVWHCLRVAGGLDSLVIGEGQAKISQENSQKSYIVTFYNKYTRVLNFQIFLPDPLADETVLRPGDRQGGGRGKGDDKNK